MRKTGQIRVGRRIYNRDGTFTDPVFEGFIPIVVLTRSTEYGSLGPYILKNERGEIMENSKIEFNLNPILYIKNGWNNLEIYVCIRILEIRSFEYRIN